MAAAAAVPVLLMNPGGEKVARRLPPRYRSGPKKGQFRKRGSSSTSTRKRKAAPKRRRRRTASASSAKTTYRRRRRRRKNPGKVDLKGGLLAVAGGAAIGGANYAMDGWDKVTNKQQAAIVAGGGLALGLLGMMISPDLGKGMMAGGTALGGYKLLSIYMAERNSAASTAALGRMYAARGYGGTPYQMSGTQAELNAVNAQLNAVEADLGAVYSDYDLSAVEADLS